VYSVNIMLIRIL